jgi:uncharacterized protein
MADGNLELIQGGYEAFGRGDLEGVLAILSDDIEWSVPDLVPQGGNANGKQEVAGFFERLLSLWEGLDLDIEDFVASGDRVVVLGTGSGTHDGSEKSYGFVHAWTVRDGTAVRFYEYVDRSVA